jgi:hypothetical protein
VWAIATSLVAKEHQLFAEDRDAFHRPVVGQLADERNGVPVPAEHLATRRARPDAREQLVLFGC